MVQKLLARDFTPERFEVVIRKAMRASAPDLKFNPDYFFPFMWNMMSNEMVSAWEGDRALLVAMFYPQIFTGELVGVVSLWAGKGSPDALALLKEFESEAQKRKCVSVHASAFGLSRIEGMQKIYQRKGYRLEEVSFTKEI